MPQIPVSTLRTPLQPRRALTSFLLRLWAAAAVCLAAGKARGADPSPLPAIPPVPEHRRLLVSAVLQDDPALQAQAIRELADSTDPWIPRALGAWRQGELFLHPSAPDATSLIPVILDTQLDAEGRAVLVSVETGQPLTDPEGRGLRFMASELTAAETTSKLRKSIKSALDILSLNNPDGRIRRDAVIKLGQERNLDYLPVLEKRHGQEVLPDVRRALAEAVALTRTTHTNPAIQAASIRELGTLRSLNSLSWMEEQARKSSIATTPQDPEVTLALKESLAAIHRYMWWGNLVGTGFRGLSLSAVLLVAALGLAITFGLMGVINMAHGEMIMVGAYTTYLTQNLFRSWWGGTGFGFDVYFIAALGASFVTTAGVGLLLERGIIRFLYNRPLESMLATWGVSLVLQQLFRHTFGAANVQVNSPGWLSGSLVLWDVLFAYNRLFVIAFAAAIVLGTWLLLTRTSVGLQVRAVMQNRSMASCLGVRTERVNMLTFAFGSGLAGMAGACLSQIGNVGPGLGQNHIVDCFMIVVLGGVGSLVGSVFASLGVGVTDQILQPWLGAVMGKIVVLGGIILFLQWRPSGMFVTRSRSLD